MMGRRARFTGTAADVQAALRGLTFTPSLGPIMPGQSLTPSFALSVTDGTSDGIRHGFADHSADRRAVSGRCRVVLRQESGRRGCGNERFVSLRYIRAL